MKAFVTYLKNESPAMQRQAVPLAGSNCQMVSAGILAICTNSMVSYRAVRGGVV